MQQLFFSVFNMSITASYVILFIVLVRIPLKKAPKIISYALWSFAGFRLLCPVSFKSIFSLIPTSAADIQHNIMYPQNLHVKNNIANADTFINNTPLMNSSDTGSYFIQNFFHSWGVYLWILGITLMLMYSIISILILKKHLRYAQHLQLNIYEAHSIRTPFVLGIIKPKIYIPKGLTESEKRYIIQHEKTHISRYDYIIKLFAFMILCIHWFNPMVWIAFLLMSTDMELSCDEKVISEMGLEIKKAYSTSLLSLAANHRIINSSPLAFGEKNVKGRIKNVLNYKKPVPWIIILSIIIVAAIGIGLISNPKSEKNTQNDPPKISENQNSNEKENPSQLTNDLEQSISNALLSYHSNEFEYSFETAGEGHVTLDSEEINGLTKVYVLEQFFGFSFKNDVLTQSCGSGMNVATLTFEKDAKGNYIFKDFQAPLYDKEFEEFIENSISKKALKNLKTSYNDETRAELSSQCEAYAKSYLKKIGKNADILIP